MDHNRLLVIAALAVAALVGAGAIVGFGAVGAQEEAQAANNTADQRTIHVSATGQADAQPDQAVVTAAIAAEGESVGEVRDELATGTQNLTAALDNLSVEYETTQYSVHEPRERPDPPRSSPGDDEEDDDGAQFEGEHILRVTVTDMNQTGAVVDAVAGADAQVRNLELTLSDDRREELRDRAIQDAMDDAAQQADTIAEAGNLAVTGVQRVDASQQRFIPFAADEMAVEAAQDDGGPPTQIATGEVSVSYHVDVTYNADDA